MLKPLVPKLCSDLFVRLRDIAEKRVPAKLKPMAGLVARDLCGAHPARWLAPSFPLKVPSLILSVA